MKGKIIKGIAGFYYVDTGESGIYECKAKGIFRKDKRKPLVGDDVEIEILEEEEKEGNLTALLHPSPAATASPQGEAFGKNQRCG